MRRRSPIARALRHGRPCSRVHRHSGERTHAEFGFTLIELIVVIAILPLVVGAISVALIAVISQQSTASNKVSDSGDTTLTSSVFTKDVQSAQYVTTNPSPPTAPSPCVTSNAIVSLQWPSTNTVVVSYAVAQQSGSSNYSLYRYYCQGLVQESKIIAYNVQSSLTAAVTGYSCALYRCSDATTAAAAGWAPTAGVQGVTLTVSAPEKANGKTVTYGYTVTGVPRTSNNASRNSPTSPGHPPLLMLGSRSPGVSCVGNDTLTVNGTAAVDSTSNPAVQTTGNAGFSSTSLYTDGPSTSPTSGNNINPGTVTTGVYSADPYTDSAGNTLLTPPITEPIPNGVGSTYDGYSVYNSGNYSGPGIYTNTLKITSSQVFASGVYIFQNGLSITGNGTVTGASGGVFFYVYGGSLSITGNGNVTLAPMSGAPDPAPNLLIWQDKSDTSAMTLGGNGGAISLSGTIYAPKVSLGVGGNGTLKVGSLVADNVSCNGGGNSGSIVIGST